MSDLQSQYQFEYETELAAMMRRRLAWWGGVWMVIWAVCLLVGAMPVYLISPNSTPMDWWSRLASMSYGAVIGIGTWAGRRWAADRRVLLSVAFWMLVAHEAVRLLIDHAHPSEGVTGFLGPAATLTLAALFVPWTTRQALQVGAALWVLWLVGQFMISPGRAVPGVVGDGLLAALLLLPGVGIAALRSSWIGRAFDARMLRRHYEQYTRDVFDARKIHAALFPKPCHDGPVQFDFVDRPRAELGGDYLHASYDRHGRLNLVMLDVQGDGISAALTVNRMHGEVERLLAENPDDSPAQVITALNRYARLMLAPLNVFAAAFCVRLAPTGELEWAGAGHAPAFVRRRNGELHEMWSTTWPLGATVEPYEGHATQRLTLRPGDAVVMLTDGALSAPGADGEPRRLAGVRSIVSGRAPDDPLDWPRHLLEVFTMAERPGHPTEDLLIAAATLVPIEAAPKESVAHGPGSVQVAG